MNIMNVLRESGAILDGHFLLSSGKHSGGYVQCAKVLRFPDRAEVVLREVVKKIKDFKVDKVVGPAMGGVVVSYEIGRQLGLESIFTERKDGQMQLRRGFEIKEGERIIIAEDVVTTGKSTLETKEVIESFGGIVVGVACIVDRTNCQIGIPIYSAVKVDIKVYNPDNCPICGTGKKLTKPGSREMVVKKI